MELRNYTITENNFWTGRIDDPEDYDSYRMHQIIKILNLNKPNVEDINQSKLNICMIGFCCDEGVKRNLGREGAKQGPMYIRKAFANLPVKHNKETVIYDAGDIHCFDNNLEQAQEDLKNAIKMVLDLKMFPIVLGGGHELALGHYNGITSYLDSKGNNQSSLGIINFDAHFDLRPYDQGGSSGTMFSQIADVCNEQDRLFAYMCLGVQISGNTTSLFKKADSLHVKYVLGKDFIESNYENIYAQINDFISQHEFIYVTLCSDVINSAFAPGVSAIQPFGMNPEVILTFIKEILKSKKVISFDVAEVSPRFDQDDRTAKLIAVIIFAIVNVLDEIKSTL